MTPLSYWLANKTRFPVLSQIARKYIQIPATSAPSERFFSQGALVINKLRNRISKDTFEMIMTLKSWGLFIDYIEVAEEVSRGEENDFIV